MTRDRIYAAELAHDTSGASDREVEACMGEALTSVVEDLMQGEKVPGLSWRLHEYLDWQDDLHELVSAAITVRDLNLLPEEIERRLRRELADHDAVHDRAAAIANERGDE